MSNPVDEMRWRVGASLRRLLGGEAEPRERSLEGGLFAPDSATWEVHGDASMLVGGIRALLLQTLHPPTMAGVADHSQYRTDPLGRLRRTAAFVGVTTFGDIDEAETAIAAVRHIHDRIEGTAPDGTPYRANDPHLLTWVHITEVDSFLEAKLRYGAGRLGQTRHRSARADEYVREMAVIASRLGVTDPPRSVRELHLALDGYRPELGLNRQSREALRFLAAPPLPIVMRAPYAVLLAGAVSSLPRWARRSMRLPRLPVTETFAVRPAALTLTRLLGWSLEPASAP